MSSQTEKDNKVAEKNVEFFWDVGSPYTYLASTQIDRIAQGCEAVVQWRPFLLGGVFRDTGNKAPAEVPAKGAYLLDDLKVWSAYYGVPFRFSERFPINSVLPMRAAIAADRLGRGREFASRIMQLYWVDGGDPADADSVKEVAAAVGLDGDKIVRMAQEPEIKDALKENSAEAVKRGAFGAPTFFVGEKMFWGNDRLIVLEAYLKGQV